MHDQAYIDGVFSGVILNGFECRDDRVPEACLWTIGSLLTASRYAIQHPAQPACSPTSGFHHAGHNFGGGFCTFNGLMVVAAKLIQENPGFKVSVLDCDMHLGDGTEDILNNLPQVFAGQGAAVSNGATGTATVNLRNLGSDRTLVLVDGRRMPYGSPNDPAAAVFRSKTPISAQRVAAMRVKLQLETGE